MTHREELCLSVCLIAMYGRVVCVVLPIDLFKLFHVAESDPVDDLILKPKHESWCYYIPLL